MSDPLDIDRKRRSLKRHVLSLNEGCCVQCGQNLVDCRAHPQCDPDAATAVVYRKKVRDEGLSRAIGGIR
jgi:hypothetical protein